TGRIICAVAHTFTNLLTHIIFSTKDRHPDLHDESRPRIFGYMGGIVREMHGVALEINGPRDHVHLLVSLPAKAAIADVLRTIKTNSSRWIHESWPRQRRFAWQSGYAAFSVSQSNMDAVR